MKRALVLAAVLLPAGWACAKPADTTYRLKVVVLEKANQLMEAKLVTLPEDLRVVCRGEAAKDAFVGDYVKLEMKDGHFMIGKMTCDNMKWMH